MIQNGVFYFQIFSQFPNLIHAASTRLFGSMKDHDIINFPTINAFLRTLNIKAGKLALPEQVHADNIASVNDPRPKRVIKGMDGLISTNPNIFIGVVTADCLPILFYDSKKSIVGVVHGGFRGLNKKIIKQIIEKFRKLGSNIDNLRVGIGPGIGVCCYEVPKDRIAIFQEIFPSYNDWYRKENDQFFLDLKRIALLNLKEEGIGSEHVEVSNICTAHNTNLFFSYRREGEEAGRFISVIGHI